MSPGKTLIKQCSQCSQLIAETTLRSGNTFGAVFWTDGKCVAPMMPELPEIIQCPQCHTNLWLADLEQVGELDPSGESPAEGFSPDDVCDFDELRPEDYRAVLDTEGLKDDREINLRISLWWLENDPRRGEDSPAPLSETERENLLELAGLLDETNNNQLIMKAELFRELGDFANAIMLLEELDDEETASAVSTIRTLAQQEVTQVKTFGFDQEPEDDDDDDEEVPEEEEAVLKEIAAGRKKLAKMLQEIRKLKRESEELNRQLELLEPGPSVKIVGPGDWKSLPMPEETITLELDLSFSEKEFDAIQKGLCPEVMEDKWFIYFTGETLYMHRSWTGGCIYEVRFKKSGQRLVAHEARVNNNPEQYEPLGGEQEAERLNSLINILLLAHSRALPHEETNPDINALQDWSILGRGMFEGNDTEGE